MHANTSNKQRLAYSIPDAIAAVSIGRSLLYEEIKAGNLKTFKIGTRTLIAADDLSAWIERYRSAA
jgi:excisionase family DNA binding protein